MPSTPPGLAPLSRLALPATNRHAQWCWRPAQCRGHPTPTPCTYGFECQGTTGGIACPDQAIGGHNDLVMNKGATTAALGAIACRAACEAIPACIAVQVSTQGPNLCELLSGCAGLTPMVGVTVFGVRPYALLQEYTRHNRDSCAAAGLQTYGCTRWAIDQSAFGVRACRLSSLAEGDRLRATLHRPRYKA